MRDTRERGRNLELVLHQYTNLVKPAFEEFCLPASILFLMLLKAITDLLYSAFSKHC